MHGESDHWADRPHARCLIAHVCLSDDPPCTAVGTVSLHIDTPRCKKPDMFDLAKNHTKCTNRPDLPCLQKWWLQISPAWIASALLAALITAITWKLTTRVMITWRQESEAQAKSQTSTADIEQPLLGHDIQGRPGTASEPGWAPSIAPVRILPLRQSLEKQYEHHAHSPLAYSTVGSCTVGSNSAWFRYCPTQP